MLRRQITALVVTLLLGYPCMATAQLTTLRVGTNSPASAESVLFSIARDAGILKQSQLDLSFLP
ncbi:MAG: hypothetical protein M3N35_12700 [Candidatus Binatota bacterium]|nr:hypothetical protein [Candidatus Binatota bacterium]